MQPPRSQTEIDSYLFHDGMSLEEYTVSETGVISFIEGGREFDLHFGDGLLHDACLRRLLELGVRRTTDP